VDANFEPMEKSAGALKEHNLEFTTIPYVLMLNNTPALRMPCPCGLTKQLPEKRQPVLEGVALQGVAVQGER